VSARSLMRGRSRSNDGSRALLNKIMIAPLSVIALLAPLLYGSNRPTFWAFWGILIGLIGAGWFAVMTLKNMRPRYGLNRYPLISVFFFTTALYALMQILPLGSMAPIARSTVLQDVIFTPATISVAWGETFYALVRWLTYGLVFFLVVQVAAASDRSRLLMRLIFWTIVAHAALALVFRFQLGDTILGTPKTFYKGSTTGGFVNRNSFATYLAFGSIIGLARMLDTVFKAPILHGKHAKSAKHANHATLAPSFVGWSIILVALVTTNSRMGLFSAACGMALTAVLVFLASKRSGNAPHAKWVIWALGLTALVIVVGYGADLYLRAENLILNQDATIRGNLYRQVFGMILDRPLLGFGGSAFEQAYPLYLQPPVDLSGIWDKTHSTYLAMWVGYGLIFGSLPILIVLSIFVKVLKRSLSATGIDILPIAAAGVILAGAIHSLVDFSLEMEGNAIVFTMIATIGFTRALRTPQSQSEADTE